MRHLVNNLTPLKQAGFALIVIGSIDILVMIYCIANQINYSSSFNIFAVIAGVFLLKGNVKTIRLVRWFSAFFITGLIGMLIFCLFVIPSELIFTLLKTKPISIIITLLFFVLFIAVLMWIFKKLSSHQVLHSLQQAGYSSASHKYGVYLGVILVIVMGAIFSFIPYSESGQNAIALAEQRLGNDYKYYVQSIATYNDSGNATVLAYSSDEVKSIQVKW